ncbi:hypothetical protein BDY17DRAFT_311271 [Neohortaea acidophila]|uniref:NmrA-like domain-containing protein n=1 Tax=Neohortaea acidophila TaxID=245834 RepID=A0A6A6PP65_9PEZI|nr:uncharacterized protein BDY17DRAFT_311271 [Neohortaea acidophila]KAF2481596.1 hypothetical protein BDY17DRAFT_311271 [Neohortaea acidophila]
MSNTWVIFGATGQQGGAVVRALLQDTTLSKSITVRAAVRNPAAPTAKPLHDLGCEVVRADLDDKDSLHAAFEGASGVFLVTSNNIDEQYYKREFQQGKNAADASVESGVQKIIFSTLPGVRTITNGHLTKVVHFDVKHDIEQYIRQLPIASSFIALGSFMQNFINILPPRDAGDGTFAIKASMPSSTVFPLIDATDSGRVVAQMVKAFDDLRSRTIYVAAQLNTLDEIAASIGKANAKTVKYMQISPEEFLAPLPKPMAEDFGEFARYLSEYGYFGPETNTLPLGEFGQLTSYEEFLKENDYMTL